MRESLQQYCSLFIQNRDILKKNFHWENHYILAVCANVFSSKGLVADEAVLSRSKQIIEDNTGIFSNFRGNVKLPMISMLAASGDLEGRFDKALVMHQMLKEDFRGSEYLAVSAMVLADMVSPESAKSYISRGKNLYQRMKAEHPFLTSAEDNVFAVLMAFSEKSDNELIAEVEKCYAQTKQDLGIGSNAAQTLSHILALVDGDCDEKCRKLRDLYSGLRDQGRKYSRYFEISVLGGASVLPVDCGELLRDILDVDEFLKGQKGYGGFGIDAKTRLMHAVMLVVDDYADASNPNNAAISALTGTLSMVAAQQAAMCAIVATSAASSAANSH